VREGDTGRARREAVRRKRDYGQCFLSISDIPPEHGKVTVFRWNTANWMMHSSVEIEQERNGKS
jgi:hypothetical protein